MSKKIKVGVFGAGRGASMVEVMAAYPDVELTAICDSRKQGLTACTDIAKRNNVKITTYTDFDSFLNHDMDAVVLANYATEHAPYAVKLLNSGRHVVSEVVACQTMAEAVALVEAVEKSKKVYTYAENYCYFLGTFEMQKLYKRGDIGEFLHGEGEYVHDCEGIWTGITRGEKNHWRNWVPATFYCTHSIGPIMSITGTRPTRITAYETPNINRRKFGSRSADGSMIVCQMSNGATAKFLPWSNFKREPGSIWFSVYGSKGMMESDRWGELYNRINVYREGNKKEESYIPKIDITSKLASKFSGHGGGDFFTMHFFIESILGREGKQYALDVYQAVDMTLPGLLGYKSILNGNIPIDIPNLRDKKIRNKYRNDNWCVDPKYAGKGSPKYSCSQGMIKVPNSVYEKQMEAAKNYR